MFGMSNICTGGRRLRHAEHFCVGVGERCRGLFGMTNRGGGTRLGACAAAMRGGARAIEGSVGMPNAGSLCGVEGRIVCRQTLFTPSVFVMANAPRSAVISMRLPPDVKARFAGLAARHQLTESGLLCKLIDEVLRSNAPGAVVSGLVADASDAATDAPSEDRITLRLRRGDRTRAAERAGARGMRTGTYLALLIHNHVCASDMLPPQELDRIKAVGAQLAALGRQLRVFDMPNTWAEPVASEFGDLLAHVRRDVESAREASAAVVRRNLMSWEAGHA